MYDFLNLIDYPLIDSILNVSLLAQGSVGYRRTKVKCAACRMVLHEECQENLSVKCRSTFRDANFKKESWTHHHWVLQRKTHTPKCRECNKSLPKGPTWGGGKNSKAFIAVTCSWCKDSVSFVTPNFLILGTAEFYLGLNFVSSPS